MSVGQTPITTLEVVKISDIPLFVRCPKSLMIWHVRTDSNRRPPGSKPDSFFPDLPQSHADYCTTLSYIFFSLGLFCPLLSGFANFYRTLPMALLSLGYACSAAELLLSMYAPIFLRLSVRILVISD